MSAFRWLFLTFAFALVLGGGGNALSEVYRWKDSNGTVHFSDQPVSTDPQVVKEVVVPGPNLVGTFKASPPPPEAEPTAPDTGGVIYLPAKKPGITATSQDSCQAMAAAFAASRACFNACGRDNRFGNGRNNTACGHCTDLPMPRC
ncbi:DUF4124 domain-containing protein [Hydrogenophaga sp. PAMC20947]|uniref:DUF4124 domain-containing protein n=1 Tax=Hydrogenophaga sp. PAMC20947 TaxID=2565558 RepID=UPI00109DFFC3|nr:DUF4124 domain-containing protein [Hydrogenophaga sp. PAMC20947]QCB46297.1 DUF4124 domain-containing protein [Hydrogenophaga sp. PAMC20947]